MGENYDDVEVRRTNDADVDARSKKMRRGFGERGKRTFMRDGKLGQGRKLTRRHTLNTSYNLQFGGIKLA